MHYTISDMSKYIKKIIPTTISKTHSIKSMFKHISGEENIRN